VRARTRATELQGHYAGPVSRLLAFGADLLFISVSLTVTLAMTQFAIEVATPWKINFEDDEALVLVIGFLWAAIYFGNSFVFGRTPGMSLLGLRIVRADGAEINARHGLVRLIAFPLGFLTLGLGFLGIIFGRTRQAIYDRIATTAVVYDWDAEAMRIREIANRGGRRRAMERAPEDIAADA
jgi:uncharacterized RDD family membrane protein YckC